MNMTRSMTSVGLALGLTLFTLLAGCGGGGSSSTSSPTVASAGIGLPSEVSAVSTGTTPAPAGLTANIHTLAALASGLPANSDYQMTSPARYVDEPTLEVFGIIETILNAMAQTHYDDAANVGAGPYASMVAWYDEQDGKSTKDLEEWIVDSQMTSENGSPLNLVHVWVVSATDPTEVELKVYQAPTQASDGSYLDYGKWSVNALMPGQTPAGRFFADADVVGGETVLRMTESFGHSENFGGPSGSHSVTVSSTTRAVMHKGTSTGYGKAEIANHEYCWNYDPGTADSPCFTNSTNGSYTLPTPPVAYAYDANILALKKTDTSNASVTSYKDRSNPVEIAYRYGVFDSSTGADVEKSLNFGFPVTYTDGNSNQQYGFYGAWQGRHQLWSPAGLLTDGTSVTQEDYSGQTAGNSYTTKTFNGTLTKRLLNAADISQLAGIPVEIWIGDNFDLVFDGTNSVWTKCVWDAQSNAGMGAESCSDFSQGLASLVADASGRKQVNINYWDQASNSSMMLMFDGTGFFQMGNMGSKGTAFVPADLDRINVWMGGSIYIEYTGSFTNGASGWEEKDLTGFDTQSWTPSFAATNLGSFDFPADREYYVNNKGVNFVVKRVATVGAASDYDVQMEQQLVVTPASAATLLSGVSYFAFPWEDPTNRSVYVFNTTSMELQDVMNGNTLVSQGQWGLMAFNDNGTTTDPSDDTPLNIQFNWEYADPTSGQGWGAVTYLLDGNGNYVYLDDPLRFAPVALNVGSTPVNFSLEFDGWMHGLPDMHWELQKNNFELSPELTSKIVNIPAGTSLTDSTSSSSYFVKPVEVGVVLPTLLNPANPPSLTTAETIDLTSIALPTPPAIGTKPTGLSVKYVEGTAVQ